MTISSSRNTPRLHGLDAVRAFAFLTIVTFHAALSFLPGPQIWVTRDAPDMRIADFFIVSHMSHLLIFFLLAGLFGRMALQRRGMRAFAKERLLRITLPALVFWLPTMAGLIAAFVAGAAVMRGRGGAAPSPAPALSLADFPLTHLWFLYALTLAYAGALIFVGVANVIHRRDDQEQRSAADTVIRFLLEKRLLAPLLAMPMALLFLAAPDWLPTVGIPTPDKGFLPNRVAVVSYGLAFGIGWLLHRQQDLLQLLRRDWLGYCLVAGIASFLLLRQVEPARFLALGLSYAHPAQLASLYALAAWSWTIGLTGAAMRFIDDDQPLVRYISDASYWIYIVHLPVVMAAQVLVYRLRAPAPLKFCLVTMGSFLILIASYHVLVRHSWLGAWLNGRKVPWRKAAPPEVAEVSAA